jgi:hypothetical protein
LDKGQSVLRPLLRFRGGLTAMLLDAHRIPEIYRLLNSNGASIDKIRGAQFSLSVALTLSVFHRSATISGNQTLAQKIEYIDPPYFSDAIARLSSTSEQFSPTPFGAPSSELYRVGSKQDLLSQEWVLFCDRFRRRASNGRKSNMFRAISGVLGEMADNVVWHAFEAEDKPCPALAAFHVTDAAASFCVVDSGQGFLRSLKRNPLWAGLATDNDALSAVVNKHATSRIGEAEGGGFNQLFNSLLDFNGLVILRTGSCTYRMENDSTVRRLNVREASPVPGSMVFVCISPTGKPAEISLENNS